MSNEDKLITAFSESLGIPASDVIGSLEFNTIPQWDSIAHMKLVAELESVFDIMLDTDDILDMSSVTKAKEILSKYDVVF
ncbi:MAG: acyl carrier protein [Gammaproteobacteria bacterium]|nr:acyl carrier protein [Gammaproteobacteria bacterium]